MGWLQGLAPPPLFDSSYYHEPYIGRNTTSALLGLPLALYLRNNVCKFVTVYIKFIIERRRLLKMGVCLKIFTRASRAPNLQPSIFQYLPMPLHAMVILMCLYCYHGIIHLMQDGFTPLYIASYKGYTSVVSLLLDKGAACGPTKQGKNDFYKSS